MLITHVEGFVLVLPSDSVRGRVCLKKKKGKFTISWCKDTTEKHWVRKNKKTTRSLILQLLGI